MPRWPRLIDRYDAQWLFANHARPPLRARVVAPAARRLAGRLRRQRHVVARASDAGDEAYVRGTRSISGARNLAISRRARAAPAAAGGLRGVIAALRAIAPVMPPRLERLPDRPRQGEGDALAAMVAARWPRSLVVPGPALSWGLWQDETTMAWQAEAGWTIVRDKLGDPAQSVLFGYMEALFYFPGAAHGAVAAPPAVSGIASGLLASIGWPSGWSARARGLTGVRRDGRSPLMITYSHARRARTRRRWRPAGSRWASPAGWRRAAAATACCSRSRRRWSCTCTSCSPCSRSCPRSSCCGARARQPVDWRGLLGWLGLTALLLMPLLVLCGGCPRAPIRRRWAWPASAVRSPT